MLIAPLLDGFQLRLLELRHAGALREVMLANAGRLDWVPADVTLDWAERHIRQGLQRLADGTGMKSAIFEADRICGVVDLFSIDRRFSFGELAYWISGHDEGRGLITEACRVVVRHAFTDLKLHRMVIKCIATNERSCAVARRSGFVLEGRLRRSDPVAEDWVDLLLFGLLAEEWRESERA